MNITKVTWECTECKDVVISDSSKRHDINFCKCGNSGFDLEEGYSRSCGNIREISREVVEKVTTDDSNSWYEDGIRGAFEQYKKEFDKMEDYIWNSPPPTEYEGLVPPQSKTD